MKMSCYANAKKLFSKKADDKETAENANEAFLTFMKIIFSF